MEKLIKILHISKERAEAFVGPARITFSMNGDNNVVNVVQIPSPRECHVPNHLMRAAKEIIKKRIVEERERQKIKALQTKLPL